MCIPEEVREKGAESIFKEVIAEKFPNLGKELDIQIHEANKIPCYLNAKKNPVFKTHYIRNIKSQ